MQAKEFNSAIQHLSSAEQSDYTSYLKAVALFRLGQHAQTVSECEHLLATFTDSKWKHKTRFLMARALIALKKHKEAEKIFSKEATRIFSEKRKQSIAKILVEFGDSLVRRPAANEIDALPPDDQKALALYRQVLELEIDRGMRDDVHFKVALTLQRLKQHAEAMNVLRDYLERFDPNWTGAVGSETRRRGELRQTPVEPGNHRLEVRYALIDSQITSNNLELARQNVDAFLPLLGDQKMYFDDLQGNTIERATADVALQKVKTYSNNPQNHVEEIRKFLAKYPDHEASIQLASELPQKLVSLNRTDEAIEAHREFVAGENFEFALDEEATTPDPKTGISRAENLKRLQRKSVYQIAQLLFNQKKYQAAIEQWQAYVNQYPDGAQWAASQSGIINAEFQIGLAAIAEGEDEKARQLLTQFLNRYPLDGRARQIMFTLGQMYVAQKEYQKAIDEWSRLISKYPNTEESSLALYRTGVFQSEQLGQLEKALSTFRRLTWGSWAQTAKARVTMLSQKSLGVATERTYRTNETAKIAVTVRNIEELQVSLYPINLESYFRKTHALGRIDHLDIDLIEPENTWKVKLDGYEKYIQLVQDIEIPFEGDRPGIAIIKVEGGDWSASTLVIRSDIDLILKSSRKEALVYVQNQVTGKPSPNTPLLFSDGANIIASGKTGEDGVYRGRFPELTSINDLSVLATDPRGSATNRISIGNMRFSSGLSRQGYIYTDKSAYRPNEKVAIRGIIRDVHQGSYIVPDERGYVVKVSDPSGRLLSNELLTLSDFGTLNTAVHIPNEASLGRYNISVHPDGKEHVIYQGSFVVQRSKLDRVQLRFDFPQRVYFRGEKITGTLNASYYWGSPAANKLVELSFPDGRKLSRRTDAKGKIEFDQESSGFGAGAPLAFRASIPSLNLLAQSSVFLAKLGYRVSLTPDQPLVLANEAFEVQVETTGADGAPVGRDLTISILRSESQKPNAALEAVPWINYRPTAGALVTVEEIKVSTDPKTGKGTAILNLKQGGMHILRANGVDRFGQVVTGQTQVNVSDDDDKQKLRFFAEQSTYDVGSTIPVRLHSRVSKGLALLTLEGEEVISHKIITIKEGDNPLEIPVTHEHFPNFRVSVAMIDGQNLRGASKRFNIRRELKVVIKPSKTSYLPGEKARVDVTVTDQLGNPVKAELSLALVNQALLARYPDQTPEILTFFQQGAQRFTEFRLVSTCDWTYTALSKRGSTAGAEAVIVANDFEQRYSINQLEFSLNPTNSILSFNCSSSHESIFNNGRFEPQNFAQGQLQQSQSAQLFFSNSLEVQNDYGAWGALGQTSAPNQQIATGGFAGQMFESYQEIVPPNTQYSNRNILNRFGENSASTPDSDLGIRADGSVWSSPITTDVTGNTTVELQMPEAAGRWNLLSKGCTAETLVGQGTAEVTTRKDFLVELRVPGQLQEGDSQRFVGTIHNLTDYEGDASIQLKISGAIQDFSTKGTFKVQKQGTTEFTFEGFKVPFTEALQLEVTATAGNHKDTSETSVPVRPWGIEYADFTGGVTSSETGATLALPKEQNYSSRKLHITLSPSIEQAIIDLGLASPRPLVGSQSVLHPLPQTPSSLLLASASALQYALNRKAAPDAITQLRARVQALVSSAVVTQLDDGSWPWNNFAGHSTRSSSAITYWGLAVAQQAGVPVDHGTLVRAEKYFTDSFSKIDSGDTESKAVVLHALSLTKRADFSAANRLYRERQNLSETALAYMAAAFIHMGRAEFAEDLLRILDSKIVNSGWNANAQHSILSDNVSTTAVALWSFANLRRESEVTKQIASRLLSQTDRLPSNRCLGPVVTALATYYDQLHHEKENYTVTIFVNDQKTHAVASSDLLSTRTFSVDQNKIDAGENRIRILVDGRGEVRYAATLSGFSPDLKDPATLDYPRFHNKVYYHDRLSYRDVPLSSYSTSPVKELELGQRIRTRVSFNNNTSGNRQKEYMVYEAYIPTGTLLVDGSVSGNYKRLETDGSRMRFYFAPGSLSSVNYELVAHIPGQYRVLPGVIYDAVNRSRMRVGKPSQLSILETGKRSSDEYRMNGAEHFELATKLFKDGQFDEAEEHLDSLFSNSSDRKRYEKDIARMLLWIHTDKEDLNAARIVEMFEILRERHPQLVIPFDKTLTVGRAYREIGEFERAWLVFQAAIQSSFLNDAKLSAVLEDQGQYLGSVRYQEDLWLEYPDSADVATAFFALSQSLFQKAPEAKAIAALEQRMRMQEETSDTLNPSTYEKSTERIEPEKRAMLEHSRSLLHRFLTLYSTNPMADDAAFSEINVYFALKDYAQVVARSVAGVQRYADSELKTSFEYMAALGHFWQRHYQDALASATNVAIGSSKDADYARYITAQIYHATGKPADAIVWYQKVRELYPDAADAIDYFQEKKISIAEVATFKPEEKVELTIDYRNIEEAALEIYKVDLMKLYLREKNLSNITAVDLAGIDPESSLVVPLGDGKDFADKLKTAELPITDEGAYLVICRGDNLFTSGLILITPLKLEIQETPSEGSVRVNVRDLTSHGGYLSEVLVKVVGTNNDLFMSGHTDLRGVYQADGVSGTATVLARAEGGKYAFYRGQQLHGTPVEVNAAAQQTEAKSGLEPSGKKQLMQSDYLRNIDAQNKAVIEGNFKAWDAQRRGDNRGVEVQDAR